MAAGWAQHLGGSAVSVFSGGSDPAAHTNPSAVSAMQAAGVDISETIPQAWTDEIIESADMVVTMGCGDTCPVFPGIAYEDWPIADPVGLSPAEVAPIRDEICDLVSDLLMRLGIVA